MQLTKAGDKDEKCWTKNCARGIMLFKPCWGYVTSVALSLWQRRNCARDSFPGVKSPKQNGCHTHLCDLCVEDAECHMCSWQKAGDNMLVTESKICARRDSCPAEPSELSENSHIISWQEADDKNSKGRQLSCVSSEQRIG